MLNDFIYLIYLGFQSIYPRTLVYEAPPVLEGLAVLSDIIDF
ncbi:hypothetical protein BPUTEOMOX_1610 [methanotrophic endosymbiont of Bathymodiolus puteoserpentis (Logatchev)]|jgi:hypothetical protein|nr:hypothetical protein BPUTEOMOX_1610 [methanotrophic endosymbiont of Bathymodiolus puteoserpentis (Logatchev)]